MEGRQAHSITWFECKRHQDLVFGFLQGKSGICLGLLSCDELFASNCYVWIQGGALQGECLGMLPIYNNRDRK